MVDWWSAIVDRPRGLLRGWRLTNRKTPRGMAALLSNNKCRYEVLGGAGWLTNHKTPHGGGLAARTRFQKYQYEEGNANPLALVAATQQYPNDHYQVPKPYKSYAPSSKSTPSTRSHATTKNNGKEIVKLVTSPSKPVSEDDSDEEQVQRDKQI
ncbi:hypothetical protein Tco_1199769 [Tanacetum coccineum]